MTAVMRWSDGRGARGAALVACLVALFYCASRLSEGELRTPRMRFGNAELEAFFVQANAAARRIAADDWRHVPYRDLRPGSPGFHYTAEWADGDPADGGAGNQTPFHTIRIGVSSGLVYRTLQVRHVTVVAERVARDGWRAQVQYDTAGPAASDNFQLMVLPDPGRGPGISCPRAYCTGEIVVDHPVLVGGRWAIRYGAVARSKHSGRAAARAAFQSPETLRDALLATCDRLEQAVRERHAEGRLIDATAFPAGWEPSEGAPPFTAETETLLTEEQRESIFREALSQIENCRRTPEFHYRQMHVALVATFPLGNALDALDSGRQNP